MRADTGAAAAGAAYRRRCRWSRHRRGNRAVCGVGVGSLLSVLTPRQRSRRAEEAVTAHRRTGGIVTFNVELLTGRTSLLAVAQALKRRSHSAA
ncbi:hypothetical protein KCP69_21445 [Salmonella enterica subsp. enterica]|nr:hypothetical protein KCP69_21445 [Salmonella enterica subsp. enterica]